ncbi:MAG: hypothetical protein ACR2LJ_09630 [Acidimicrobiales bacterium]
MSARPARPRSGSRATFPVDVDSEGATVAALGARLDLSFPDGRSYRADLGPLGHRRLMVAFAGVLTAHAEAGGGVTAPASASAYVAAMRRFSAHLDGRHPNTNLWPADLSPEDIDSFEERLRARYSTGSTTPSVLINKVVFLLRMVADAHPVRTDLTARLRWGASGPTGNSTPRDAYSGAVAASLRRAARAAMCETIARLTVTGPQFVATSRSPWEGSWRRREDVAWEINRAGLVSQAGLRSASARQEVARPKWSLAELHRLVYPANEDLAAFFLAFALESGMEVECIRGLRVDCLVNPARGYVEVLHTKNRRRGSPEGRLRVRDGNLTTPGGILRAVITITARARRAMGTDALWVCYGQGRLHRTTLTPFSQSCPIKAFVAHHDLRDDDGQPLHLVVPRLRKTHKAERYRATGGRLDVFVTGHSTEVAAKHYADIPALRETHEQAVADGLTAAAAAATGTAEPVEAQQNEPLGPLVGHLSPEAGARPDSDVWLANCADFHASPFAPAGKPCSAPPWACLECTNATFDTRKLPALIAFASWCEDQRVELPAEVWAARLGRVHARVTRQVLPAFPEPSVVEAAAIAGTDPLAAWLPIVAGNTS